MKKTVMVMVLLGMMVLSACSGRGNAVLGGSGSVSGSNQQEEETEMTAFEDNKLIFNLVSNPSTGYSWQDVYQSDSLEQTVKEYKAKQSDQIITGAPGIEHFEYLAKEDGDACLILKYARPWEGDGNYKLFMIHTEGGKITGADEKDLLLYSDFKNVWSDAEDLYISFNIPADWQEEAIENQCGLKVTSADGKALIVFAAKEQPQLPSAEEKILTISGKQYQAGFSDDGEQCFYLYCAESKTGWICEEGWDTGKLAEEIILADSIKTE